ncbi:MAG: DUF5906 domain-containing protein, partial [Akkermansia sp.]
MEHSSKHTAQLPCIKNLKTDDAEWLSPWTFAEKPKITFAAKADYKAYIQSDSSQSCLYSGIAGLNPNQRVSRNNPPTRLHAIVADYDTSIKDDKRLKLLEKLPVKPSFISSSYSGGTHAIWLLEEPLPLLPDSSAQQALLKQIAKELKLKNAFGVLDETAFYNTSQVYHVGWNWEDGGGSPIPAARALLWLTEARKKASSGEDGILIPIERVAQELEKRFPNRWHGEFNLGSRGCRFWDAQADNHSAAIVTEHGMVCFTGPHSFRSWKQIFGTEFISEFEQETVGAALRDCYFIGNKFYAKCEQGGNWSAMNRQNTESYLASTYGLRTRCDKNSGEDESEVKRAIGLIIRNKSLTGTSPFIYNFNEVVQLNNSYYLNTSTVRVMPPAEEICQEWGEKFPWIASFLEGLFPDIIERERFVNEWAYAYRNAYAGKPKNGRTIFIAGEPGVGKNFITEVLIGPSMGGYGDASDYLLGATRFNEHLFNTGVWVLNDTVGRGDWKERSYFTKMLKKMSANMTHNVEGKFKNAATINWCGRVFITLNTDPISLGLLPELDINNRDKISMYRTSKKVLDDANAASMAQSELPYFCSYMLHMDVPEHCQCDTRWGVKGFLNGT